MPTSRSTFHPTYCDCRTCEMGRSFLDLLRPELLGLGLWVAMRVWRGSRWIDLTVRDYDTGVDLVRRQLTESELSSGAIERILLSEVSGYLELRH